MIKLSDILQEIGEGGAAPYILRRGSSSGMAEMDTVSTLFYFTVDDARVPGYGKVSIDWETTDRGEGLLIVDFDVETEDQSQMYDTTNLGLKVMFRVMATVVDAVKAFQEKELEGIKFPINIIKFEASEGKSTGIMGKGQKIRSDLYTRYIQNYFKIKDKSVGSTGDVVFRVEPLQEGVIKNITLAGLLGLAAAAGISPDAQAQTKQHFQGKGEKIVNVVNNKGQVEFRDIAEFKKHFENNLEDYQQIGIKPNSEFFIVIDDVPFVGYVGVSKDMQTSLKKAGGGAVKAGKKSGFLLRDVQKAGNNYVGVVLYRVN